MRYFYRLEWPSDKSGSASSYCRLIFGEPVIFFRNIFSTPRQAAFEALVAQGIRDGNSEALLILQTWDHHT